MSVLLIARGTRVSFGCMNFAIFCTYNLHSKRYDALAARVIRMIVKTGTTIKTNSILCWWPLNKQNRPSLKTI